MIGFGGHPIHHDREIPEIYATTRNSTQKDSTPLERDRDDLLPIEGWLTSMRLISYEARQSADPVCLHDRFGKITYQWPEGYIPTRDEVRAIILKEIS